MSKLIPIGGLYAVILKVPRRSMRGVASINMDTVFVDQRRLKRCKRRQQRPSITWLKHEVGALKQPTMKIYNGFEFIQF